MRWFEVSSDLEGEGEGKEKKKKKLRIGTVLGHFFRRESSKRQGGKKWTKRGRKVRNIL
jgi:hypothetical protein